ncbi:MULTISPECIES: IS5/IS1182 family transposase [unclassified Streptomyces]|uniref:IS5/IS1182 family transposase n=1 Tax=unclassified Streptomyces TaxID=2593676 RepID=UPI0007EC5AEE|nr:MULTISPECIES: IS5/IS1182 family transposase [unclassified Streptomyces]MCP3769278.1 IS5/IS1182 family transposase [Streptomyces sp. MAR25Y5]OBQ50394.1 transposase [Streptomyces sp. H-KF8]
MLVYPSGLDLSSSTLRFLSGLLSARRRERGTRWRRLPGDRQALLVLAHLRCGHTSPQLAAGFGVGVATVYRYVTEAVEILAALAPDPAAANRTAARKAFVILDGTVLPLDRIAADRPYYSGKHRKHGMNVQVLADPHGRLLWASPALPGAVHDVRAARTRGVIDALAEAGMCCWADQGYQGAGGTVHVPYRGRWERLSAGQRAVNVSHARIRALGEQVVATLKTWRLLRRLRCSTTRITALVQAVLTLHLNASE